MYKKIGQTKCFTEVLITVISGQIDEKKIFIIAHIKIVCNKLCFQQPDTSEMKRRIGVMLFTGKSVMLLALLSLLYSCSNNDKGSYDEIKVFREFYNAMS